MNQIAFYIGEKGIHWYGVMIALGYLGAIGIIQLKKKHAGMTSEQVFDLTMIALFGGLIGARVFYVVQFWDEFFANDPLEIIRVDHGGLVFYGGFLVALAAVCIYAWRHKISIPLLLDVMSPAMAFAHACGRIGCFLQGCCFGKIAPKGTLAVSFPVGSAPATFFDPSHLVPSPGLYPVQLYESGLNFLLCVILLLLFRFCKKGGQIAAIYFIIYAILRFSLEFIRGDHTDIIGGLTPSQNIALWGMIPLGIALLIYWSRAKEKQPEVRHV